MSRFRVSAMFCFMCASSAMGVTFIQTPEELAAQPKSRQDAQEQFVNHFLATIPAGQEEIQIDDMIFRVSDLRTRSAFTGNMWPKGKIFYEFDADVTAENQAKWIAAAENWSAAANVTFTEKTSEPNFIYVENSPADPAENSSEVGMTGGSQQMVIYNWNWEFIIVHEIGHALGLIHEHTRLDRDDFVTILTWNIEVGKEDNFIEVPTSTNFGDYDFNSVMHYAKDTFGINDSTTILPLPEFSPWRDFMGQRTHLSFSDRFGMTQRYGWRELAVVNSDAGAGVDRSNHLAVQLTTDNAGTWIAVWNSKNSNLGVGEDWDILYSVSTNNGATWSPTTVLNSNAAVDGVDNYDPQLTTDGAGTWIAVWTTEDAMEGTIGVDRDVVYVVSTNDGATWSPFAPLSNNAATDTGDEYSLGLTTDGAGTWIAAWMSYEALGGTDTDILYTVSTNNGTTWDPVAALNSNAATDTGDDFGINVTTDGAGTWIAAWQSYDSLDGMIGTDLDILYAKSTDNGTTWTPPAALSSNVITDTGNNYVPRLTTNGAGTWIAMWYSTDTLGSTIGDDIDILCSISTNNGASWDPVAPLNNNAAMDSGNDYAYALTTDSAGTWVAVWRSDDSLDNTVGTDWDVLYAVSTNDGMMWSAPAALNSNAFTDDRRERYPELTTDGLGTWIAMWSSNDTLGGVLDIEYDLFVSTLAPLTPVDTSDVWIDFGWPGFENGTVVNPFNTLTEGVSTVRDGGLLNIKGGHSAESLVIGKAVRLEAYDGSAVIGQPISRSDSRSGFVSRTNGE